MKIKIKPICILSKAVFTALSSIIPEYAIPLGVVELIDNLEFDKKQSLNVAIEKAIDSAINETKKYYKKRNKNADNYLEFIDDISIVYDEFEYYEFQNYMNNQNQIELIIERIIHTDYFVINSLTKKDARIIIKTFERFYYEAVSNDPMLSNYYTLLLNKSILNSSLMIKSLSDKTYENTNKILSIINKQTDTLEGIDKKTGSIKEDIEKIKTLCSEIMHSLAYIFSSFGIYIILSFLLHAETSLNTNIIILTSFILSEFFDKFINILLLYLNFSKNICSKIKKILIHFEQCLFQIIVTIVIMFLLGISISNYSIYIAAIIGKLVSEILKKLSNNRVS